MTEYTTQKIACFKLLDVTRNMKRKEKKIITVKRHKILTLESMIF